MTAALARLLLALLLVGGLVTGCGDDEVDEPETVLDEVDEERVAELVTGEPFEATATVDEVLGEHAFLLLDALVVTLLPVDVEEGSRVRVTGEVSDLPADQLEEELDVDLPEHVEERVGDGDELYIVASDVEDVQFPPVGEDPTGE